MAYSISPQCSIVNSLGPQSEKRFFFIDFIDFIEKSHRLWTKNKILARGLLALKIKISLGIHEREEYGFDFVWSL